METLRLVALPGNGQSVVQPKALAADRDACPPDSAASDRDRNCQAAISIGGRRSTGDRRSPAVYRLLVDRGDLAACDRCALVPSRWPSDDRQLCVGTGLHDDRYRHLESIRLERLASGAVRLKAHRGRARLQKIHSPKNSWSTLPLAVVSLGPLLPSEQHVAYHQRYRVFAFPGCFLGFRPLPKTTEVPTICQEGTTEKL